MGFYKNTNSGAQEIRDKVKEYLVFKSFVGVSFIPNGTMLTSREFRSQHIEVKEDLSVKIKYMISFSIPFKFSEEWINNTSYKILKFYDKDSLIKAAEEHYEFLQEHK